MEIRYVPYVEIDRKRWDACLGAAPNRRIYAESVYLDTMADQWDALIGGDYDAIMPLCYRKKYGISYLYQPAFTASLGIFSRNPEISSELVAEFLEKIPRKFRYWDIYLNHACRIGSGQYKIWERVNYVLPLNEDYSTLSGNYRENVRRNVRKCRQQGGTLEWGNSSADVIAQARIQATGFSSVREIDYQRFDSVFQYYLKEGRALSAVIRGKNGQLLASALFLLDDVRATYILVGNHPDGRTMGASHALIDGFIQRYAGTRLLLDFEGSDIRNLAFFYSSFGAKEEYYQAIRENRLPLWLRWLKQ